MSIKILQEISSLVTDFTKNNRYLEIKASEAGGMKYLKLIEGLGRKAWKDDEEAIQDIYGKPLGDKTFDMLKSRAKERLVNMIFQLDTEKKFKSSYDKAYYSACKNLLAGTILLLQNKHLSGSEHLKLSLSECKKYFFTDISIINLRLLRYLSSFSGSVKNFDKYNTELKANMKIMEAELFAEELNQLIILEVVRSMANKDELASITEKYYKQLQKTVNEHDTYTTRINMYRVGLRYYESADDFRGAISLAESCENYLKSNPHLIQKVRLGEMNLHKLNGCLHLRDYQNGSKYAAECMVLFNSGTLNWLIFLEYYFLLSLHTRNYEKAAEIYNQVINHPSYTSYPGQNREKWKIFESFLSYALPINSKFHKKFNVFRFINEVPLFTKDKAGYNLSIIVAQTIILINLGDYEKLLDKAESLKLYASRYIRKDKNPRSYYFIKMLLVMIQYDFDPKKTAQISQKFFVKLKESHLGVQSELETLEVIPYDLLWPEILEKLELNRLKKLEEQKS
ncbi:MAG: hypothetical protein KBH11_08160 [Bacteroidia bacterium]|nr:hypothetical protein [Bacteroidota bacterium]MBL0071688.1 hypothetical protein [Bacteroidota bacterium]MBP9083035.1 hypothetical protein [Bacteroidia bacterium]